MARKQTNKQTNKQTANSFVPAKLGVRWYITTVCVIKQLVSMQLKWWRVQRSRNHSVFGRNTRVLSEAVESSLGPCKLDHGGLEPNAVAISEEVCTAYYRWYTLRTPHICDFAQVWRADADFGDAMAWNNELIKHFSLRKNFTVLLYRKRTKDNRDLFCTKTWFWQDPAEHSHWNSSREAMLLRACKNYVQKICDASKCGHHAQGSFELPPLISRPAWYRSSPTSTIHIPLVIIGATPEFVKMVSVLIRIVPLK